MFYLTARSLNHQLQLLVKVESESSVSVLYVLNRHHSFIHSQALKSRTDLWPPFLGFLITHIQTHGRTPLDE
jgi:hypothetical protein